MSSCVGRLDVDSRNISNNILTKLYITITGAPEGIGAWGTWVWALLVQKRREGVGALEFIKYK